MELGNLSSNISSILSDNVVKILPSELASKIDKFISISKMVALGLIGYIIFAIIIKNFLTWKKNKRIKIIYSKVKEIDKKLDFLLKKSNLREKREVKIKNKIEQDKAIKEDLKKKNKKSSKVLKSLKNSEKSKNKK